ncbi:MAG TPA: hypothetical protein VMJ32_02990 [Pirellulales bacterium]|nr:hypothetical protein [Pirellulales bacterium]
MRCINPLLSCLLLVVTVLLLAGCSDNAPPADNGAANNPAAGPAADNSPPAANTAPANNSTAAPDSTAANGSAVPAAAEKDTGDTPEAAFGRYKTAMQSKDYKTAFAQTTPDSQEVLLGAMATTLNIIAALDQSKEPDIRKIFDTYGVKKLDLNTVGPNVDQKTVLKQLTADVKDKPACLADIYMWIENNASDKSQATQAAFGNLIDAELADVKIDGDTATATAKTRPGGVDKSDTLKFKKIDGIWQLDLSDSIPAVPPQLN